jgi:hypothetical protein
MPQDRDCGRKVGFELRPRKMIVRWLTGVALLGIAMGINASVASAQTYGSDNEGAWNKFMKSLGMNSAPSASGDLNYTERSPLVVPPTRDLPSPGSEVATPTPNWPKNSPKPVKHAKAKDKPDILPDTAVQTPNPPFEKKPWYNPAGWFNIEEYATFAGEPIREQLTDPPAGYRVPSPEQPYGISPEKKKTQAAAKDFGMSSVTPPK